VWRLGNASRRATERARWRYIAVVDIEKAPGRRDAAARFVRRGAHRGVALGVVAALLALAGLGVLWQRDGDARAGHEALARAEQAARSSRTITAAQLTDMPFSRLVVVPGTAGADDIRRAAGTDWGRADELAYHCCDPAPIWVFVNDDEVVAFFRASWEMGYGDNVPDGTYRPSERLSLSAPRRGEG
jgi:hypothetical protein